MFVIVKKTISKRIIIKITKLKFEKKMLKIMYKIIYLKKNL